MGPRNFLIAVLMGAAIATGLAVALHLGGDAAEPVGATVLPATDPLPQFDLLDHDGRPVGREVFEARWSLVFFGFTHCPDICPMTLQLLAGVRERLAASGQDPLPRVVLVSVDPERDTPPVLARYVAHFGTESLGITGDIEEIRRLTDKLGIWFEKAPRDNGDYSVDHSAAVYLIGPDAVSHALFGAPHSIETYLHDLPLLMVNR